MTDIITNKPKSSPPDMSAQAREIFSARLLTDAQFEECVAITNIIGREIRKSGTFKEKLGDYSYAFSRSEKFDPMKAETILRDVFKARTGVSMNQLREKLVQGEQALTDQQRQKAYEGACQLGEIMERGDKLTFNRALSSEAQGLAKEFGVTDTAARRVMAEEFQAAEQTSLYEWGKELDEKIYRPQIEAERQQREQGTAKTRTRTRKRGPSRAGPQ